MLMAANTTYEGASRTAFYWSVAAGNWIGAGFEGTVAVFLFSSNLKRSSPLKSAFFCILACGYTVDFLNTLFWLCGDIVDYENDNVLTIISVMIQWYASFFEGFWNFVLACNRCSALAFPAGYNKLWNGKFYALFVILVLIFPLLCNGYTLITNPTCRIYFYSIDCYDFQIQNTIDAAIVTICMSVLAFLIANYGFIQARKSKKLSKASRLLVIQTIVTATFQALCSAFFAHSALTERDDVYFWEAVSAMFSFLQHYPSVVLLFFVSQSVRQDYYKFYRLKCLIHKDRGITLVSPATFMPASPRMHHDFAVTQVL